MSFVRKILAPAASVVTAVGIILSGAPPELVAVGAASAGHLIHGFLPTERSRQEVAADTASHASRALAYEAFGASVAVSWQAAGILLVVRPGPVGYVHTLAMFVRAQRRFEDQTAAATAALSRILLYGSSETQQAALTVFRVFGEKLTELGRTYKRPPASTAAAFETASLDLGDAVVAWRTAAQADLVPTH